MKCKRVLLAGLLAIAAMAAFLYARKPNDIPAVVDFEVSMGAPDYWEYKLMMSNSDNERCMQKYEKVYYQNIHSQDGKQRIPKIIHQIWLGPKQPPDFFEEYRKSWSALHPGWQIRLWRDKDVATLDMDLREEFETSQNWGEKSDILRAEILDRMGGVYVDVDIECVRPFDELVEKYDFFAGIEPPHVGVHPKSFPRVTISNALIGACRGHPIIKSWKRQIKYKWYMLAQQFPDGKKRVMERTFHTFGEAVYGNIEDPKYCNIVFPATYFYPLTFSEIAAGRKKKRHIIRNALKSFLYMCHIRKKPRFSEVLPETMAVHYWGGSWIQSSDELLAELQKRIDYLENFKQ